MPSADIDKAVAIGTTARTQNNGQSCIAAKRFIIHEDIYDVFKEKLSASFNALIIGDPMDAGTDIGPLVNARSAGRNFASRSRRRLIDGARLRNGAGRPYLAKAIFTRRQFWKTSPKHPTLFTKKYLAPWLYCLKSGSN